LEVELFEPETFIQLCLKNNPLAQKFQHLQCAERFGVKIAASSFLPAVNARLEGQFSNTYNHSDNIGFQEYPVITDNQSLSAAIEVSMPIFDGGSRNADYRSAELRLRAVRLDHEKQKRMLITQCRKVANAYQVALQNVVSAREVYKEQASAFAAARQEYALGATSMVDLVGLEEQCAQSMQQLVDTMVALTRNSYELRRLAGKLTPDMMHVGGKKYSIDGYRKAYAIKFLSLGKDQSKTSLYEAGNVSDHSIGSSLLKRLDRKADPKGLKSGMKEQFIEFFGWYPTEGIALLEGEEAEKVEKEDQKIQEILKSLESKGVREQTIEKLMEESLGKNILDDIVEKEDKSAPDALTDQQDVPTESQDTVGQPGKGKLGVKKD
jgi:hypothetical protein